MCLSGKYVNILPSQLHLVTINEWEQKIILHNSWIKMTVQILLFANSVTIILRNTFTIQKSI